METNQELAQILNDLILINNDRIVGYDKAINELTEGDRDLKNIFTEMANESRNCKNELSTEVMRLGEEVAEGTTNSGKIYRMWMDIKASFGGNNRQTALNNCEFGEDAIQNAYEEALDDENLKSAMLQQLLTRQKQNLKRSHDLIRDLRDAQKSKNK